MRMAAKFIPTIILWILPLFYGLSFLTGSLLQLHYFVINDVDFSFFLTQPWRIWNFGDWNVPFGQPIEGGAPFYCIHFTPLSAILAPIIGLFPSEYTLACIHATSITFTAFLLPRIALQIHGEKDISWAWTAFIILLLFFFFRPYLTAWFRQTHFTTLVSPFLALACLLLLKKRIYLAFVCAIIICFAQERAAVGVFGLGIFAFFMLKMRKTGIAFCLLSSFWFFGAVFYLLPWFRTNAELNYVSYIMIGRIGPWEDWPQKLVFLIRLCSFCCFLPFCGRKALVCASCALPNLCTALLSHRPGMYDLKGQYEDLPSIFLLISMIYGLFWLQDKLRSKQWKTLFAAGTCAYMLIVIFSNAGWYNPVATSARLLFSPHRQSLEKLNDDLQMIKNIPENIKFYAQSGLGPRVALHNNRFLIQKQNLDGELSNSLFAFSPFSGTHELACEYSEAIKLADKHPDLIKVADTGRLNIYITKDLPYSHPDFIKRINFKKLQDESN